jgi:hypothetical protein
MSTNVAQPGVATEHPRRTLGLAVAGLALVIAVGAGYAVSQDVATTIPPGSNPAQQELDEHRHARADGLIPKSAWAKRYEEYAASS